MQDRIFASNVPEAVSKGGLDTEDQFKACISTPYCIQSRVTVGKLTGACTCKWRKKSLWERCSRPYGMFIFDLWCLLQVTSFLYLIFSCNCSWTHLVLKLARSPMSFVFLPFMQCLSSMQTVVRTVGFKVSLAFGLASGLASGLAVSFQIAVFFPASSWF